MAGISLRNNLTAMNTRRMLGLNDAAKLKSTEKLSSGYKINRAADDAAGLAISEKMRKMIRGLKQGTENAQDGISWVQTGDGALDESQEILKRMVELSVKALNGTNSKSDRADMQAEFEQLKVELDRISTTTKFNEMNIFSEHKPFWYQCKGAVKWEPNQMHVVTEGENDLTFMYRQTEDDPWPMTMTITVPPGEYSTVELLDEIDTAISDSMGGSMRIFLEYNKDRYVDATLEGGGYMDYVSGGLSYLLYDMYKGGTSGALIGTTIFSNENVKLDIRAGKNDSMTFDIEYFDGRSDKVTMTLPQGKYTRKELINLINKELAGTSVEASAYGTGIKLGSPDAIITGFKGNMFRIDGANYTSVFYDNVQYGSVSQHEAVFTGGYVLNTDTRDKEHEKIQIIAGQNDVLTLQPNGAENPVSLTLPPGEYTMEEICDKLNSLFQTNQLDLKASVISASSSVGDGNAWFKGLEIRSGLKGPDSQINLDPASSAFNTLFVTRNYNQYGAKAAVQNETAVDPDIWFRGSKNLTAPITITSDNDTFKITFKETNAQPSEVTITLAHKTYTTLDDLVTEINAKIDADPNSKGKLKAQMYITTDIKHRLQIDGVIGKDIDEVSADAVGSNKGFDSLFQGWRTTVSGTGSVVVGGSITSDAMTVVVGGKTHIVTFPHKPPTKQEIVDEINKIKGDEDITPNKFDTVSARGTSWDYNFSASGTGTTTATSWSGSKTGDSKMTEGKVGFEYSIPAELELGPELKDQMVIGSGNNTLFLTLNGVTKSITLPPKTYNPQSLRDELQQQIDQKFGTQMGGAEVILHGNKLTLKSRLPMNEDGADTSISCGTNDSTFLRYLNTKETAATCTGSRALASSIAIDSTNNKFTFQYTENGNTQNVELTLSAGNYSPSTLVTQLNTQLSKTGTGVQASLSSNGRLVLTSTAVGNGVSITYNTKSAGSAMDALYGTLSGSTAAEIEVALSMKNSITIDAASQNFTITVDGAKETVTLAQGTYTRTQFVTMLNSKLSAKGVEAYLVSGDRLKFRTTDTGSNKTLSMDYDTGGDSMVAIYGTTTTTIPGVHAEWVGDNLKLTAIDKYGNPLPNVPVSAYFEVVSGGGALSPTVNTEREPTEQKKLTGNPPERSKVDGADLASPIAIDQWNNELKFTYTENGTAHQVSITVTNKSNYTYQELQDELQDKIDKAIGETGKLVVTVDSNGVVFTAAARGNQYKFSDLYGNFYQNVLCKCTKMSTNQNVDNKNGDQKVQKAYVIGRKDVVSQPVEINQGVSDELSLDLTINGSVHKIKVTLDPGRYSGNALKAHLQEKIDQACVDLGLVKGLVEVGIGGISSGVAGGNDQKALNFSLSDNVILPGNGDYIIDGVSGNAAFEVFYQTDGRMVPAYIMGTKDITNGVTVRPGETGLSVCVDGVVYSIQLEEGPHTGKELADEINRKLEAVNAPLGAHIDFDTGRLKIAHKLAGDHDINWVSGSAKDEIFFEEDGDYSDTDRRVQLSDENPDYIELARSEYSASLIGVNSLCLTGIKYASKALDRLGSALEKVSSLRSNFGSTQNRLEHALNNNRNKTENLQSAESVIRDTDMAKEMVWQSTLQILAQAGFSMLAQADKNSQAIIGLLE